MKIISTIIGVTASVAALSAPALAADIVYLECKMPAGGESVWTWKLALDESAKTVSWEHPKASGLDRAIFTSDAVKWKGGRFEVSRTTLKFSRENILGGVDEGQCAVVTPPKRAF